MAKHSVDFSHITAGALALALAPAFWPSDAAAHTCDAPFKTDLVTGTGIDVGQVKVCNDDTTLTVTYETIWPWCVLKTNLHVASDLAGIPKFRLLGTPNFLQFEFSEEVDCEVPAPVDIRLSEIDGGIVPGDTVTIAARAVVEGEGPDGTHPRCLLGDKCVAWGKGPRFRPRLPAMYFTYEVQGPPPATSCVCDSFTTPGGRTGTDILEELCPDGMPPPGGDVFVTSEGVFVIGPDGALRYDVVAPFPGSPAGRCNVGDDTATVVEDLGSLAEHEACRAHLVNSCGLQEP